MVTKQGLPALQRAITLAPLMVGGLMMAGCMSSPTYGTDKTSNEQLLSDVTGMVSLGGKQKERIDYKPRPELVRPGREAIASLPTPQDSVASTGNSAWPESPEERRARIRADATANQDNPSYRSEVVSDIPLSERAKPKVTFGRERPTNGLEPGAREQRGEFNRRLTENRQGDATSRKYLSEPPLAYREPSATAPANDVGEDEAKKERRAKAEARAQSGKTGGLRSLLPW